MVIIKPSRGVKVISIAEIGAHAYIPLLSNPRTRREGHIYSLEFPGPDLVIKPSRHDEDDCSNVIKPSRGGRSFYKSSRS